MIAFLKGELLYRTAQSVILNVQGVGYEVRLSKRHLNELQVKPGETLELTTHLLPREDSLELYGFVSFPEKELFLQLTKVSGVGPRTALAVFSCLELNEIVRAIVGNQPRLLSQAPGIGPKTAQRIILDLREKLEKMQTQFAPTAQQEWDLPPQWLEEIEMTLLALGYESPEIQTALSQTSPRLKQEANLDEALRVLLEHLAGL